MVVIFSNQEGPLVFDMIFLFVDIAILSDCFAEEAECSGLLIYTSCLCKGLAIRVGYCLDPLCIGGVPFAVLYLHGCIRI